MKLTEIQKRLGITDEAKALQKFLATLRPSQISWNYFVDWDTVFRETHSVEIYLNSWNYLLGKENFETSCRELLKANPDIVRAIPTLLVRTSKSDGKFLIQEDLFNLVAPSLEFDFSKPALTKQDRDAVILFLQKSGLDRLFEKGRVRNLVDYVYGVEAGLNSHARKNRAGKSMESVVQAYLEKFCDKTGFEFLPQATAKKAKEKWGVDLPADASLKTKTFDFLLKTAKDLIAIEVNFYSAAGSKPIATVGEYKTLSRFLKASGITFIWVSDGKGWFGHENSADDAIRHLNFFWNLSDLHSGLLYEVCQINSIRDDI